MLIDPVFEQVRRDAALLGELGLTLVATLETHVHADHVTGAWLLKRRTGSRIMLSAASGADGADRYLAQDDVVAFGGRRLLVRATPGHTNGCLTYVLDDRSMAFTGDCLLDPRQRPHRFPAGRRGGDVPLGARADLHPAGRLPALSGARLSRADGDQRRRGAPLQPAPRRRDRHRRFHRLHEEPAAGAPEADRCRGAGQSALRPAGRRQTAAATSRPADPHWAPLRYSFAGVWEIDPHGLEEHAGDGADPRCARAGRVHRPARPHHGRGADPARRTGRARRRTCRATGRSSRCAAPAAARRRRP